MTVRDTIVVGASAGGVEALMQLCRSLPRDLPAAVLVVLHCSPNSPTVLPKILHRAGPIAAVSAEDGAAIQSGRIYVAPPDHHLVVEDGHMRLWRGAKEHHSRPAVDPLFRTAAQSRGRRVVGVILSGARADGSLGLLEVKRNGGVTIIQDPEEAMFPDMPRNAAQRTAIDYVLPIAEIAATLSRLAREPIDEEKEAAMPSETDRAWDLVLRDRELQTHGERHGMPALFTCPECGGTLWQLDKEAVPMFRCHVGHIHAGTDLLAEQSHGIEAALWTAIRLLADKAVLARQLEVQARQDGNSEAAVVFEEQAAAAKTQNETLRRLVETSGVDYSSPGANSRRDNGQ